jgi:hypothetical protein
VEIEDEKGVEIDELEEVDILTEAEEDMIQAALEISAREARTRAKQNAANKPAKKPQEEKEPGLFDKIVNFFALLEEPDVKQEKNVKKQEAVTKSSSRPTEDAKVELGDFKKTSKSIPKEKPTRKKVDVRQAEEEDVLLAMDLSLVNVEAESMLREGHLEAEVMIHLLPSWADCFTTLAGKATTASSAVSVKVKFIGENVPEFELLLNPQSTLLSILSQVSQKLNHVPFEIENLSGAPLNCQSEMVKEGAILKIRYLNGVTEIGEHLQRIKQAMELENLLS